MTAGQMLDTLRPILAGKPYNSRISSRDVARLLGFEDGRALAGGEGRRLRHAMLFLGWIHSDHAVRRREGSRVGYVKV